MVDPHPGPAAMRLPGSNDAGTAKPVSDEPIESVITRFGSSSRSFSLMLGENSAAVLANRNNDDRS